MLEKKLQTMYVVGKDGTKYLLSRRLGATAATAAGIKKAFLEEEQRLSGLHKEKKALYHALWRNIAGKLSLIYHKVE